MLRIKVRRNASMPSTKIRGGREDLFDSYVLLKHSSFCLRGFPAIPMQSTSWTLLLLHMPHIFSLTNMEVMPGAFKRSCRVPPAISPPLDAAQL